MKFSVKFSVKVFPVGVLDQIPGPSHLPSQISCDLWRSQIPRPKAALFKGT